MCAICKSFLLLADARVREGNALEKSILNGEILHLFKMLCGHLYEAGIAFRQLDQPRFVQLDAAVANDKERKEDLNYLRHVYAVNPAGSFHYAILKPIRDYIGFHYKEQNLNETLRRHADAKDLEGNIIVTEYDGLGRYSVTDHFGFSAIQELLGATPDNLHEKFAEAMLEALKIARALFQVVDHLLFEWFKKHEDAIIAQIDGEIIVSPEISRDQTSTAPAGEAGSCGRRARERT